MRQERRSHSSERRGATHASAARSVASDFGPVWLTVSQLCRRWQLGRKTVYKFIDAKILPAWKVGSHLYRVAVADVLHFEARNRLPRTRT
jgi:excisionase family DNA binding protein